MSPVPMKRLVNTMALWGLIVFLSLSTAIAWLGPTYLKSFITQRVALHTGRTLIVNGPVTWHLSPQTMGVELHDLRLSHAPSFEGDFMSLKKICLQTPWKSIITGSLKLDIQIDGLILKLVRNTFGKDNWSDLKQGFQNSMLYTSMAAHSLRLNNSAIIWEDHLHQQHLRFKNLALYTTPSDTALQNAYNPLTLNFDYEDLNHPLRVAAIQLETQWRLHRDGAQLDLKKMIMSATMPQQTTTTLHADLKLKDLTSLPRLHAQVQMNHIPLNDWLKSLGLDQSYQNVHLKTILHYQYPTLEIPSFTLSLGDDSIIEGSFKGIPKIALADWEASGSMEATNLSLGTLPITNLRARIEASKGLLSFENLEALTAGIQHEGRFEVDLRTPQPRFSAALQSNAIDLHKSLEALHAHPSISGKMRADSKLWTEGSTLNACLQNIEGQSKIQIQQGELYGIALMPLLEEAQATLHTISKHLLKRQPVNTEALLTAALGTWKQQASDAQNLHTTFDSFDTDISLKQGVLHTEHFKLQHPAYIVEGKGFSDLKQKQADYQIQARLRASTLPHTAVLRPFLEKTPLFIQMKGPLEALMVQPQLGSYAEEAIQSLKTGTHHLLEKTPAAPTEQAAEMEKLFGPP